MGIQYEKWRNQSGNQSATLSMDAIMGQIFDQCHYDVNDIKLKIKNCTKQKFHRHNQKCPKKTRSNNQSTKKYTLIYIHNNDKEQNEVDKQQNAGVSLRVSDDDDNKNHANDNEDGNNMDVTMDGHDKSNVASSPTRSKGMFNNQNTCITMNPYFEGEAKICCSRPNLYQNHQERYNCSIIFYFVFNYRDFSSYLILAIIGNYIINYLHMMFLYKMRVENSICNAIKEKISKKNVILNVLVIKL